MEKQNFEYQGKTQKQVEDSYKFFAIPFIGLVLFTIGMVVYEFLK